MSIPLPSPNDGSSPNVGTDGRDLSEVRRTRYTTNPTMRFAFVGFSIAYHLRRYHPDTRLCGKSLLFSDLPPNVGTHGSCVRR